MFTQGLDNNAVRWVKEGSNNIKKEVPYFMSNQQPQINPISSRNMGRGFGLPPASKFRSGHLPGIVPISQVLPGEDTDSASENDMSTDSEGEVYGGRYSLDSSHPDDIVPPSSRYHDPLQMRPQYHVYSSDVSSCVETMGSRGKENVVDRFKGIEKNQCHVRNSVYTEDESDDDDDSRGSSELSTTQVKKDVYPSHVSRANENVTSRNDLGAQNIQDHKAFDEDIPSAPPFVGPVEEIKQEEFQHSKTNHMPLRDEVSKQSNSNNVCGEGGASSGSIPARLPTFHASSLGPWHSVVAYDACVRLCLHAWAKGCSEAVMFLENECALLRSTFGLQQTLLQSEEELHLKHSSESEVASKGAATKPKKMVGKMKVQVRKHDKLRWWCIYREPEHELVGKIQLYINYTTSLDDSLKCGSVAETVAYDIVMEVAMKVQNFQQRNLLLHGSWQWLLIEFASYYGVSDAYTKLRYLSYVMDVATPTADCVSLVYDLLLPVMMKGNTKSALSHQENRILGEIDEQIEQILALVFENYKSLNEQSPSGIMDVFTPATGVAAPVLEPAVKLYKLLHDILSPEAQNKLYSYFQAAAKKRSRRHLTETDEYVSGVGEGNLMDSVAISTAYKKMKSLCMNIKKEIFTDIEIQNSNILPSFIDLPNLSTAIYSAELASRLRAFLVACPPTAPSLHVAELVIATADFQKDLASWNINHVKNGVDAKELFHLYIMIWIQDKRMSLLETCKMDTVKWCGVRTQHSTTPFVDEMYNRLIETLNDYEVIISRWPEYTFALENAIADIEKAIIEALDKQYADVIAPLKENMTPKKFGLKYVQKLTKRTTHPYVVPPELGILLNSMKRMLDILRPKIELQLKSWGSCCIPDGGNVAPGERLSEVTVMFRSKFRNYIQAVAEKLLENTRLHNSTKLKKILKDSKESVGESEIRCRMQPLTEQLTNTMNHLYNIFETHVFIATCRGYWDRMGQDVLSFLENRKENRSWYKGSRVAVSILDDTFASQMQQLVGNTLEEKDVEPPRSIVEVRSMLCKDAASYKNDTFYY
ncbi:unnamed protein product [Lactuca saligna]|uniref:Uncharacterized protein n=1 Tax=Lactuca saligna TaxID=75948 RepID=A0AA35ZG92_LACSI|nr:unnamed protein product [Lactuca saligna]